MRGPHGRGVSLVLKQGDDPAKHALGHQCHVRFVGRAGWTKNQPAGPRARRLGRTPRCESARSAARAEKKSIFEHHLRGYLGPIRLDEIDLGTIQRLKAVLGEKGNGYDKALSQDTQQRARRRIERSELCRGSRPIEEAPRIRQYKFERREMDGWEFEEGTRLLDTARREGATLFVAMLLAGDAGLRLGEVFGIRWEDVDLVAGRLTVTRQIRKHVEGTPKSGRRRSIPMTASLVAALKALPQVRVGRVVCGPKGEPVAEAALKHGIYRVCRRAGLREWSWHALRHTFATHAARFGVNPWRLQAWLGQSTINMTMRYAHHVKEQHRPVPATILAAGATIMDPDERVVAMLGARSGFVRGKRSALSQQHVVESLT
ncbi:MAG TPA: site-specific integrase [Polyangia bacterium]